VKQLAKRENLAGAYFQNIQDERRMVHTNNADWWNSSKQTNVLAKIITKISRREETSRRGNNPADRSMSYIWYSISHLNVFADTLFFR
jgi:hypothetical protein